MSTSVLEHERYEKGEQIFFDEHGGDSYGGREVKGYDRLVMDTIQMLAVTRF